MEKEERGRNELEEFVFEFARCGIGDQRAEAKTEGEEHLRRRFLPNLSEREEKSTQFFEKDRRKQTLNSPSLSHFGVT